MKSEYLIDRVQQKYYPELEHEWNHAEETFDVNLNKTVARRFSLLQFESDFRVSYINSAPEPEPYYANGEEVATSYFDVSRTMHNAIYQGAEELELGGKIIKDAGKFRSWTVSKSTFDYRRKYLDVETNFLLWRLKPPIIDPNPNGSNTIFDDYELLVGENIIHTSLLDSITLPIPQGVWGVRCNVPGVFLVDSPNDTRNTIPVTASTKLITKPYIQFRKSSSTKTPFRVSLRGRTTIYLPGEPIPKTTERIRFLTHPPQTPRRDRLTPPNVAINYSFLPLSINEPVAIANSNAESWSVSD